MGYFTQQTMVVPIDTDDVTTALDTVTIRKLTYQERQACMSMAMRIQAETSLKKGSKRGEGNDTAEVIIDGALLAMEQVKASLVSWEGPGFEGRPATGANLVGLPAEIVDKISAAADRLNQGLSDEEKNP